jgi:hypothetical protein
METTVFLYFTPYAMGDRYQPFGGSVPFILSIVHNAERRCRGTDMGEGKMGRTTFTESP